MNALAAAHTAGGGIDWGACLLLAMPLLLVVWVLGPMAPPRSAAGNRVFGITIIIGALVLLAVAR